MFRIWAKSKISNAKITQTELEYEGSITLPPEVIRAADIMPGEMVQVLNMNNGSRLETYVIEGDPESRNICLNGPAARKGMVGDRVMVVSYGIGESYEVGPLKVVQLDGENRIKE